MREFFKSVLLSLSLTTGSRQAEFLSDEETTLLLDSLTHTAEKKFGYIPYEIQKAEIRRQLLEDPNFTNLNVRIVNTWLFRIADKYWKIKHGNAPADQADPGPLTPETLQLVDAFKKSLLPAVMTARSVPAVTEKDLEALRKEDALRIEGRKSVLVRGEYQRMTPEELLKTELHHQYLRAKTRHDNDPINYDATVQNLVIEFMSEGEWLEQQEVKR